MDQRLFHAAWNGDVDHLLKHVEANPTTLHTVALEGGENPLHIACLAGHLNFTAAVIKLRQQFSWELNQDGFSPLHIAAACGHGEIVKELLKVDLNLCLIEGKDRKIPLHLAVIKGNVEVVKELLLSSLDSIECTTAQGETSLHLAVKNCQFKAFQALIHHLKQSNKEDLLNSKDFHGNTILHLAVSRKQYEVVEFLLNGLVIGKEKIELNPLNKSGLTPLDMLHMFHSEAGDGEIAEILIQTGALKARNLQSPAYTPEERPNRHDTRVHERPRSSAEKLLDYFKYNNLNDSPSNVRSTFLVIVTLITAATYQPALSPPGGFWQDDLLPSMVNNSSSSITSNTTATKPHTAGQAIMLTNNPIALSIFLIANSVGFYTSLHMIFLLTKAFPLRIELYILVIALSTTYSSSMTAIAPDNFVKYIFIAISIILPFMMPVTIKVLRNYLNKRRIASADTSQERV
ncbi:putative ankyrin repeat-containing domain, PGG domain, ankyrin repeat-containing domain superfamily [Helianthus annuus]|nr:putative ankyrin repeat-containing domain, PGG domain, ankyrin repeat-containing domain superfamily [Helianthus annuus]